MIKVSAEFDFTRIRKYHHNIEFLASSAENRQEPINTVYQDVFIDLKTENDYKTFVISFEQLLETYNLQDENVLEILYLAQLTYADIETATEINFELLETHVNLTFLKEVIRLQEADKARKAKQSKNIKQYADLDLTIQSLNGSITLKNPIVTDFVIAQLVKAFRDKSYNFQLATALENQEITYSNLSKIIKELNYRTSDVNRFCTAQTALRILNYLNEQTTFNSSNGGMSNKQVRFIFDLLKQFNLLKNIIDLKDIPRDKSKVDVYKTTVIKTLIKNHKSLFKEGK